MLNAKQILSGFACSGWRITFGCVGINNDVPAVTRFRMLRALTLSRCAFNGQCRTFLPHSAPTSCVPSSQEKTEAERQKVLSTFEGLRLFLEDQARHLLAQLAELERAVEKMQEENITNLTKEISHLDTLIQEMEEKCQEPASKFLQVRNY